MHATSGWFDVNRAQTQIASIGLALLMVVSVFGVANVGFVQANHGDSFVVTQGNLCQEVTAIEGDEDVVEFYDYRNHENTDENESGYASYSSWMPDRFTDSETSRMFLYDGPNGLSLVVVHNEYPGDTGGSAATVQFTGLPSGGDWVVQDDLYQGSTNWDQWNRDRVDWTWASGRTDGGVFRGLDRSNVDLTVDPSFNEDAELYEDYNGSDREGQVTRLQFVHGDFDNPNTTTFNSLSDPVRIQNGHCPIASVNAPGEVQVDTNVEFDASTSVGDIAEYQWEFGDGTNDTTGNPVVSHVYNESGEYEASVTVVGQDGDTDTATVQVSVQEEPLVAELAASSQSVTAGADVEFDASDSQGDIDQYHWEFGDGTTNTTENPVTSHAYDDPGEYDAQVTVESNDGRTSSRTLVVDVHPEEPAAELTASPQTVDAGATVAFDASNSEGDIAEYQWSFGDGATENTNGPTTSHAYEEAGTYEATVTVEDGDGQSATATVTIEVQEPSTPTETPTPTPTETETPTPTETETETSGSGGGGGGGGGSSGGGNSGSSGGSWSSGSSSSSPNQSPTVSLDVDEDNPRRVHATVDNAVVGEPVEVGFPTDARSGVNGIQYRSVSVSFAENGDYELAFSMNETGPQDVDAAPTAGVALLSYLDVSYEFDVDAISEATVTFDVDEDVFSENDIDPERIALYHFSDGEWSRINAELVGEEDGMYEFEADVPGFSTLAVGTTPPLVRVDDVTASQTTVQSGERAEVTATVVNDRSTEVTHVIKFEAFGEVVDTREVVVPANGSETVTFEQQFNAPGTYDVSVNNVGVQINVEGESTTPQETTDSPGQPGFSLVITMLALVATALLAVRRRD